MQTNPVRHTVNAVTLTSLMSFIVLLMLVIFVMSTKSGVNSSDTLLRIHLWGSLALAVVLWLTFKVATRQVLITDTGFELRGMFVDRFVPFHLVDFVTITGGLALVLTDGGHRPIPGFDPSPYGEMRRYRLHHAPGDRLQEELDRSRLRDVEGEAHETTRFRPDLLVLVATLVLSFLSAQAIEYLFAS